MLLELLAQEVHESFCVQNGQNVDGSTVVCLLSLVWGGKITIYYERCQHVKNEEAVFDQNLPMGITIKPQ